jgi:hypothetical protein
MHVGKTGPYELRLRPWMTADLYPEFITKQMEVTVPPFGWHGLPTLPPSGVYICELFVQDTINLEFSYRGDVGFFSTGFVEIGFVAVLTGPDHTDFDVFPMTWWNGIEQIQRVFSFDLAAGWYQLVANVAINPPIAAAKCYANDVGDIVGVRWDGSPI